MGVVVGVVVGVAVGVAVGVTVALVVCVKCAFSVTGSFIIVIEWIFHKWVCQWACQWVVNNCGSWCCHGCSVE